MLVSENGEVPWVVFCLTNLENMCAFRVDIASDNAFLDGTALLVVEVDLDEGLQPIAVLVGFHFHIVTDIRGDDGGEGLGEEFFTL